MILHEVVDHRSQLGHGGAELRQQPFVLAGVMGVNGGAEAETVAEQVIRNGGAAGQMAGAVGQVAAQRRQPLPQTPVYLN